MCKYTVKFLLACVETGAHLVMLVITYVTGPHRTSKCLVNASLSTFDKNKNIEHLRQKP